MPRKSTKSEKQDAQTQTAEKQAEQKETARMVAAGTFECAAHEGRVKAGASFTTTEERAAFLEGRGLARRAKS